MKEEQKSIEVKNHPPTHHEIALPQKIPNVKQGQIRPWKKSEIIASGIRFQEEECAVTQSPGNNRWNQGCNHQLTFIIEL